VEIPANLRGSRLRDDTSDPMDSWGNYEEINRIFCGFAKDEVDLIPIKDAQANVRQCPRSA